jgi:hypothetical protein
MVTSMDELSAQVTQQLAGDGRPAFVAALVFELSIAGRDTYGLANEDSLRQLRVLNECLHRLGNVSQALESGSSDRVDWLVETLVALGDGAANRRLIEYAVERALAKTAGGE